MSLRGKLSPLVSSVITSRRRQRSQRRIAELRRRVRGEPHRVFYFHQVDDPYSALAAQVLPAFLKRYDVVLEPRLVPAPPDWAAPERQRLVDYSRRDAGEIAPAYGLSFDDPGHQPPAERVKLASRLIATHLADPAAFADIAHQVSAALWSTEEKALDDLAAVYAPAGAAETEALLLEGAKERERRGHYLGATFGYGGEWYWGIDRLHYLEARLRALGADREPAAPPLAPAQELSFTPVDKPVGGTLDFFLSLRSPYTYIAMDRLFRLADHYGVDLRLRPVLPMVMRGLPVPNAKRIYIVLDVKREAERLGISFGRIADPVGPGAERGLSLISWADQCGKGRAFVHSFTKGAFADGIDASTDAGLAEMVTRAGLDWREAQGQLSNDTWRAEVEANREEMFGLSLWGVPSFRYGDLATWGQDRLWLVEQAILRAANP